MSAVKPVLRGYHIKWLKKVYFASVFGGIAGALVAKHFYADPRKQRVIEFYKTYDDEAAFEDMRQKGLFQNARPDGEE